jgi:TolB-like protein/DNA-binding winged helix-turn-helix (wHTH) protein/tetratricopeptide (TPR) repeat protein
MSPSSDPLQIGDWVADPRDDSLTRGAEREKLEPRTMRLLIRLALTPGVVVSQDELLESVWSGVVVGSASVYQSMSQLRKVLGDTDDPPRYIETVARKGYRLIAAVSVPQKSPLPARASPELPVPISAPLRAPRPRRWLALAATVGALAVLLIVAAQLTSRRPPLPETASIVVLPFIDLTDGHTQQMFCDGLTEETSNWLAQVPTLRVVARSSAFSYRDRKEDVRAIGRELNTSHVLEGSLRRSGNRMRITVQLIDTSTGYHLWSDSYDVEVGDVLRVQEDVARKVAGNLELRISSEANERLAGRRSSGGPAQELFLNARAQALKFDSASNELAITFYRQALRTDPSFALAKIYLAQAIGNRRYFSSQRIEDLLPEILPLLADAEKTAPQLPDLYAVRGSVYANLRRRDLAERDLKRAIEMNPNNAEVSAMLGRFYLLGGEPREALSFYTITSSLDPRDFGWQGYRCMALTDLAQFDEADKACAQARTIGPGSPWVYVVSSNLEAARGRWTEALQFSAASLERDHDLIEMHAERGRWLRELGFMKQAGVAFREAVATDSATALRNDTLLMVGVTSSLDAGGGQGLKSFVSDYRLAESDDPIFQFELANAWLTAGEHAQATKCIERAMASAHFTNEDLESPWFARTGRSYLLVSAMALRANGEEAAADRRLGQLETLLTHMTDSGVRTAGVYELKAQLAAMRGRGDDAIAALKRAVDLGWSGAWLAEHEPYFASLRNREDFRSLLAAVRARNASTAAKLEQRLPVAAKAAT